MKYKPTSKRMLKKILSQFTPMEREALQEATAALLDITEDFRTEATERGTHNNLLLVPAGEEFLSAVVAICATLEESKPIEGQNLWVDE